jgi:hypothetical protein
LCLCTLTPSLPTPSFCLKSRLRPPHPPHRHASSCPILLLLASSLLYIARSNRILPQISPRERAISPASGSRSSTTRHICPYGPLNDCCEPSAASIPCLSYVTILSSSFIFVAAPVGLLRSIENLPSFYPPLHPGWPVDLRSARRSHHFCRVCRDYCSCILSRSPDSSVIVVRRPRTIPLERLQVSCTLPTPLRKEVGIQPRLLYVWPSFKSTKTRCPSHSWRVS